MSGMVSFQPGWQWCWRAITRGVVVLTLLAWSLCNSALAQNATPPGGNNEKTWAFNFKETDINELVRYVAKSLDKTIIVDPKVKGKVKVITSNSVNAEQMYDLFLSILEVHGFAAVESGDVIRVIPSKNARTSPVPVKTDNKGESGSAIITQVIQLENISAAKLIPVLRPLAPQQAHMAAYAPSNAIIISDTAANIRRIRSVIKKIDLSAVQKTDVVELEHASAEEVVRMLEQLKKNQAAKGQAETKKLVLVADKRTNSILISGDELERQRVKALIKHIDTPLTQSGNVQVIYLEYAKAKDLAAVLTKVVQNMERMSTRDKSKASSKSTSTIEADEGTNSLIITAEADVMKSLAGVIERLDIRRAQVLVEAIIVELSDTNGRGLGVEWLFINDNGSYGSSGTGAQGVGAGVASAVVNSQSDDDDAVDIRTGIGTAITQVAGSVLGVGRLDDELSFSAVLNAVKNDTDSNLLSTPSLMTLDNEEATITVGQNISFVTGSFSSTGNGSSNPQNPFQTVEQQNVGVTLKITPHINEGDSLILEIEQDVSSVVPGATVNSNPTTSERKINTKVLTDNGQTIVLGGLIQDSVTEQKQKVPVLGDIPFMGVLFRNSSSRVIKQHLLVFIRATIVRDKRKMDAITAQKYQYIRDEQLHEIQSGANLLHDEALPLLPEWQQQLEELKMLREQSEQQTDKQADEAQEK